MLVYIYKNSQNLKPFTPNLKSFFVKIVNTKSFNIHYFYLNLRSYCYPGIFPIIIKNSNTIIVHM